MGTHPIFESDFDCLTAMYGCLLRHTPKSLRLTRYSHALRKPMDGFSELSFVKSGGNDPFLIESKIIGEADFEKSPFDAKGVKLIARPAVHGEYASIALLLSTGARHSGNHMPGICHIDEKLAFGATEDSFLSRAEMSNYLDQSGAICDCQADQELTIYALSLTRSHLENGVKMLVESAFRPKLTDDVLTEAVANVKNDILYSTYETVREKEILDLIVQTGFKGSLGIPRSAREIGEDQNWATDIKRYRSENYLRENPVFVGVGVKLEELEELVQLFIPQMLNPTWCSIEVEAKSTTEETKWTGGFLHDPSESKTFSIDVGGSDSYFCVGWKAPSYQSKRDRYASHVLRSLLGGGGAFESGGPGKGLHALLYCRVLASLYGQNFTHFKALYKEFSDSGIFAIYGMCPPEAVLQKSGFETALKSLKEVANGQFEVTDVERAKTQLANGYLRDMEVRAEMMESLARETAVFGDPVNPLTTVAEIKAVKKSDLIRVATEMLRHKPAFAVMGNTNNEQSLHKAMANWTPEVNNKRLMGLGERVRVAAKSLLQR